MKRIGIQLLVCIILAFTIQYSFASERKINFDKGWKFYRGYAANAEQIDYNDSKWQVLDLPHDWSMDPTPVKKEDITVGPFSKYNEGGAGGADVGQTLGGEGWYRKQFTIPKEDAEKQFTLYIEGAYNQSEVFVNGKKVNFSPYGYTSYKLNITDYCNPAGMMNTIAIRVINAGENSRWYAGSGLYRHVWLIKTDKVHLDEWDTFVRLSELKKEEVKIKISTIIHNVSNEESNVDMNVKIYSPKGKEVATDRKRITVSKLDKEVDVDFSLDVSKAELWSIETPVLYLVKISLSTGDGVEEIVIPFGIRTLEFTAEKGFLLNGKLIKLKGGCIHHDNGLLGAVAIDRAEERKVELMKANGYNAVRCAHNQVSEYFLNACDRLGLLVIHETFDQWQKSKRKDDYHQFFDEWSEWDLAASLRRDRNHPSIIMWSIGNEIEQRADEPEGDIISKKLVNTILKYDNSRFTTVGANDFWDRRNLKYTWNKDSYRAFQNVDIAGYNYMCKEYESDHISHPNRIIYGSESYPKETALNWNLVEKHPYIIGDFVWTAIDYIGEAGLGHVLELGEGERNPQFMGWPWYNAWCGDIDFCGDKKPQSYYRDIVWRERDISLAIRRPVAFGKKEVVNAWGWTDELLSWNWPGLEGETMRVNIYSRSPKVRLYQDGKLIGEKETGKEDYTATFDIIYHPGELKAVNVEKNKEKTSAILRTIGKPVAIRLIADRQTIRNSVNDLSYVKIQLVDRNDDVVPDSGIKVKIKCDGNGSVIAAGNAAPDDMESFRSMTPKIFRGTAVAIVQPDGAAAGEIKLTVSAEGFEDSIMVINTIDE